MRFFLGSEGCKLVIRKQIRDRERSRRAIDQAVESGDPFSYLYEHMDEMSCVLFDDFMYLFRAYPPITITSHDLVNSYERNMYRPNREISMMWDLILLLRNRGINDVSE